MRSLVEAHSDKTLLVSQSKTALGTRRPSVFGANLYNQHLAFSSDSEDMNTYYSQPSVTESEVQGAENGPVLQHSNLQRIKRHIQDTKFQLSTMLGSVVQL